MPPEVKLRNFYTEVIYTMKPESTPKTPEELIAELKTRGMSSDDILKALCDPTVQTQNIEAHVSELMRNLGVPANVKGYRYLRRAIIIFRQNPDISMTKELYPILGKEFNTTAQRVERAMRHAIELSWERGDINSIHKIFGCTVSAQKSKPTNSEFISMLADKLYLEGK